MSLAGRYEVSSIMDAGRRSLKSVGLLVATPAVTPPIRPYTKGLVKAWLRLDRRRKTLGSTGSEDRKALAEEAKAIAIQEEEVSEEIVRSEPETLSKAPAREEAVGAVEDRGTEEAAVQEEAEPAGVDKPYLNLLDVPEFSEDMARQAWDMGLRTEQDVLDAAEADKLRDIRGVGETRQATILDKLKQKQEAPKLIEEEETAELDEG